MPRLPSEAKSLAAREGVSPATFKPWAHILRSKGAILAAWHERSAIRDCWDRRESATTVGDLAKGCTVRHPLLSLPRRRVHSSRRVEVRLLHVVRRFRLRLLQNDRRDPDPHRTIPVGDFLHAAATISRIAAELTPATISVVSWRSRPKGPYSRPHTNPLCLALAGSFCVGTYGALPIRGICGGILTMSFCPNEALHCSPRTIWRPTPDQIQNGHPCGGFFVSGGGVADANTRARAARRGFTTQAGCRSEHRAHRARWPSGHTRG